MPNVMTPNAHQIERHAPAAVTRETKTLVKRIVLVIEPEQDIAWLGRLQALRFEPILMTSNFDAVQLLNENHELRLVLFAQRSPMMDGISACQLLRQSRSEADIAIVLMLDDKLEESISEAFAAGASDVVCQPFHTGELVARLDATLQRLLLGNDIESGDCESASAKTLFAIPSTTTSQKRPHFGVPPVESCSSGPCGLEDSNQLPNRPSHKGSNDSETVTNDGQTSAPLLLGDWLLTHDLPHGLKAPSLDLSQLKFVPSLPARQLEAARHRGELSEVLLDRVWVCPQCRAIPSFRPACPCCGSAGAERDRLLHHFACAFVGATAEFQFSDEGLSCPKCCTQRLMVGTDCEFLDGPWHCPDCDWNTAELEIVGHCLKCGFRFPAHQAVLEDLVGHCCDKVNHPG